MSVKYRVKLENNRIVGPFSASQVAELFSRGHITEQSACQEFPAGDWLIVEKFEPLKKAILKNLTGGGDSTQTVSEATVVKMMLPKKKANKNLQEKLSETPSDFEIKNEDPEAALSEFKFGKEVDAEVDYDELEKRYQEKKKKEANKKSEKEEPKAEEKPADPNSGFPGLEKTRVLNRQQLKQDMEATRVVRPPPKEVAAQKTKEDEAAAKEKMEEKALQVKEAVEEESIDSNEATEFINVGSMLPSLKEKATQAENEIITLAKQKDANIKIDPEEFVESDEDDEEEDDTKKKKMRPIVLIAFIVVFWFLFFDEDKTNAPVIAPKRTAITFPSQSEYLDEVKAAQAFNQGVELYSKQNYLSLISAAKAFQLSLFHKFQNNPALGYLIMVYARLYPNAQSKLIASNTLFNLVRVAQDKLLTDPNVAIGTAEFYNNAKKYLTAVRTIENYLRVTKKPTVTMLSVYLESLVKAGRLSDSKEVFEKLSKLNPLPIEAYVNMSDYLELDEKIKEAQGIVEQGLKQYPNSVRLLLKLADHQLRIADAKAYEITLKKVEALGAEQCPTYYAQFLEHMGNASVLSGKFDVAANFYRESLKINESPDLRTRLANLSVGGSAASQALIKESKIHELMKKSRFSIKEHDWESAFVYAIEAVDLNPLYIQSNLLLVDIQVKRGYYSAALKTLLRLKKQYPANLEISTRLIEAYVSSFRFNDAINTINEFAQVEDAVNTPAYASMLGRYYFASNNDLVAIKWLTEAVNRNPLADDDLFLMAKIYVKNGKYKDGRLMLSKALMLDPVNLDYQTLYAQIIYDQDGADTAIGYLRDLLKDNKDSPKILGEIAKYYYKSGQIKEFNLQRKKIEDLGVKDESFYRFMIYASELNQQVDKILEYGNELIKINPGDVITYMKIGEYLAKQGRYQESIDAFMQVKERLDTYPKINYMISKSYLEMNNLAKAQEFAELEIKNNPKIPQGYFVYGLVLIRQQQYPKATKQLEKAVTIDYGYVEALVELASLKRRQNNHEQARELLLRALKGEPNNPLIHRELGYVYRAVGQGALAIESFKTYLTLLPGASDRSQIEALIRASN